MNTGWLLKAGGILFVLAAAACAPVEGPSISQQQRASDLIDQGVIYLRQGELDRARAAFLLSEEIAPSPAARDGLGCVAFRAGDGRSAEEYFVQAIQMDPNYGTAHANLALLYERDGHTQNSRLLYREALAKDPEDVRARNNFGAYLNDSERDRRRARDEFLKASALAEHEIIEENIRLMETQHEKDIH